MWVVEYKGVIITKNKLLFKDTYFVTGIVFDDLDSAKEYIDSMEG